MSADADEELTAGHGAPIEVRTYGERGPQLVVLHGGPGAPGSVASLAKLLATDHRVLEPLQRRSGGGRLSVARHVSDLAAVAPREAILIGWSWGAMLALSYATRWPDRARAVALVGCGTYDPAARATYVAAMAARMGPAEQARKAELKQQLAQASTAEERDRLLAALGALSEAAQDVDALDAPEDQALLPNAIGHGETWADALRLQDEGIEPAAFAAIRAPVLMLHGEDDPHPGPATRDTLRRFVPQLEYVELARCGHRPWLERRAQGPFVDSIRNWVERVAP